MAKGKGGFIGQDGLNAPDSPTAVSATAGNAQATVSFTAPSDVGGSAITRYNIQTGSGLGLDSMIQEVDLANGSYDSKEYSVARNDISMKADGIKWIGKTLAGVFYSYTMSTPFDITTSSQTSTIDLGSNTGNSAQGLHVKPDGTKFYVIDLTNTRVLQFAMSTAWDVSTASYESKLFGLSSQESSPRDITFSEDGTKMYAVGTGNDSVFQYTLSSAWDVSTASYASKSLDVSSQDTAPIGLDISRNGKNLVVGGAAGNDVNQYNLTTAFDVSTGSYSSTLTTLNNGYFPALAGETDTTTKMYVTTDSVVRQYSVGGSTPTVTSSPFTFTGLTNGTAYTFSVWAINAFGYSAPSDASGSVTPPLPYAAGGTALIYSPAGGSANIYSLNMTTQGNAVDSGYDLTASREDGGALGNDTRSLVGGGQTSGRTNSIDFVTYASLGNATDFGDLTLARDYIEGEANNTRGLWQGGTTGSYTNVIDYVTIASAGNASDFGDMSQTSLSSPGFASSTRAVFKIAFNAGVDYGTTVEYVTIASTGNSTDFGDDADTWISYACSNNTRGLFAGSAHLTFSQIRYFTIASTGNYTDFGDLTVGGGQGAGVAGGDRAAFIGGTGGTGRSTTIDFVTITTTGDAADFGDISFGSGYRLTGSCSGVASGA